MRPEHSVQRIWRNMKQVDEDFSGKQNTPKYMK